MTWLFAQVWVLFLVAFLLGAAATWLAFVRPLRAAARRPREPVPTPPQAWAGGSANPTPPTDLPPVAGSALAEMDAHARHAKPGPVGTGAVEPGVATAPLPVVPPQAGPPPRPEVPDEADAPEK